MDDKLKDLYQEVILKHNNQPLNFKKREDASCQIEAYNPVCGDQFNLYFDIEEDRIVNLSFHGYGCAISKASASILTQTVNNVSIKNVLETDRNFRESLFENQAQEPVKEAFKAFIPVRKYPGRIKCVTLPWDSLVEFLNSISPK